MRHYAKLRRTVRHLLPESWTNHHGGHTTALTSILWRRLDQPGHDSALLHVDASGARIEGAAVFLESGRPCRLDYRIVCDSAWRTLSARVNGWLETTAVTIEIDADAERGWTLNGKRHPDLQGAIDVDLSFTPATNLLPMRRLRLGVGEKAPVRAAWLSISGIDPRAARPDLRAAVRCSISI